ncbi:MAG: TolC family protein [Planctomycetota bacterium]
MRRCLLQIGYVFASLVVLLSVTACGPDPLSRLDREAADILEHQRDRSLGIAAADVNVTPPAPSADPRPDDYERQPETVNPPADALTIEPAPPRDRVPDPAVLDDGTQPDTLRLDLEGLIGRAIENAPDYRRQREDLFLTTLSLIVERHEWGPRFFSAVTGRVDGVPEAGDNETALNLIASLGVTQRLPYGGSVSATALVDYVRLLERASTTTLPTETDATELQFSLDLPLLRGAGRSAATVESRIQAERDLVYAVRDFERFRRTFFVDIATRYFDLLRRQRQLQNQELQLQNFRSSAELFSALAEAGRAPFFRAQRAEQRVLRAQNSLLNQQEGYVRQLDALKLEVGIDPTQPLEILAVEIDVPEILLDLDTSVATALRQRLDLQTVGDTIDDARRGVQIARNGLLPDLDLDADVTVATDTTLQRGGLDFELGDSAYDVGLTLGLPLDRKIEYTDFRAALIRLERQRRDFTVERDRVSLEVRRAVRAIEQARFVLQLQERAIEINEKRAEQIQIDQRSLGPNEVIDVQEDLLDARNDRDEAASDLRISILEYLLATGQMRIGPDGRWRAPASLRPVETPSNPPPTG